MSGILGISGLAQSVPFKRAHWPGLEEREYRISQGHDAAAALIVNGRIVGAAAEERFNRRKHSGDFPVSAVNYCLGEGGIALDEVDEIVHAFDYSPYQEIYSLDPVSSQLFDQVFAKQALLREVERFLPGFPADRVHQLSHHLCHAASAYFTSGWEQCLVVVLDAMGETQSASIYRASHGQIERIRQIPANDSVGILYSVITLHLGFDFNSDEYKIMGLAPYGDPGRYERVFGQMLECRADGSVRIPILRLNRTRDERENYLQTRAWLEQNLIAARAPEAPITQEHCDVAAALQACLNRAIRHICGHFAQTTANRRLAMAGGVALNCTANGLLMRSGLFDEIYIQPAAGDDGAALGAALYCAARNGGVINERMSTPFLGPSYGRPQIESELAEFGHRIAIKPMTSFDQTCIEAAQLIGCGKVVAWYRGRMEFGPRALGNRSILADPGDPGMRDRINAMVKMREAFRPFAPAVTIEEVHRWFEVEPMTSLPFMIATAQVRPQHRATLPAVTHVDGSARVQTVSTRDNPAFHGLLRAIGKVTGRQMVLNTSFNVKGQPIVNTPREAIETFLGTGIDYLFLDDVLVARA